MKITQKPIKFQKIGQNINIDNINKKYKTKKRKNIKKNNNNNKNIKYIDEEFNRMDYEEAIISDQRTYWQYYYSLLKKAYDYIDIHCK